VIFGLDQCWAYAYMCSNLGDQVQLSVPCSLHNCQKLDGRVLHTVCIALHEHGYSRSKRVKECVLYGVDPPRLSSFK
jgi:hypothetical protein